MARPRSSTVRSRAPAPVRVPVQPRPHPDTLGRGDCAESIWVLDSEHVPNLRPPAERGWRPTPPRRRARVDAPLTCCGAHEAESQRVRVRGIRWAVVVLARVLLNLTMNCLDPASISSVQRRRDVDPPHCLSEGSTTQFICLAAPQIMSELAYVEYIAPHSAVDGKIPQSRRLLGLFSVLLLRHVPGSELIPLSRRPR